MLEAARRRSRKLRRAVLFAVVSGWSMAAFAVLSAAFAILGGWESLAMGVALGVLGANELRGAARLRRFDDAGARILGVNQLALAALLALYAAWSLYGLSHHGGASGLITRNDPSAGPEVNKILENFDVGLEGLSELIGWVVYGAVGFFGVLVPGLTAVYYFTRAGVIRRFRAETPAWVLEAINAAR